ncbi:uncharacterized protein JCM6883_004893 [Sporobolomyces salmoneus]|uniref:uncharacterized protein n=1 Tax=Sporobolomyces salmoneus TaxID=183962 RepID=UPI00317C60F2
MDEAGFHARRRDERLQRLAATQGKLGHGLATTVPLQEREDVKAELREKVQEPAAVEGSVGGAYDAQGYRPGPHVPNSEIPGPTPTDGPPSETLQKIHIPHPHPLRSPDTKRKMSPRLLMMTGSMLRYDTIVDRVWHGFAMIVTTDEGSDYSTPPSLTCEWDATGGSLAAEFDKLQVSGEQTAPPDHPDYVKKYHAAGQKIQVYHSIAGAQSFWRFKLEIPLGEREEEIFYSINNGPESSFWVPAFDQEMRVMYHSCNGFSGGVDTDSFNGPDPLWRDVLRKHEEKPIHCIVGGGDQIYCDPLTKEPEVAPWINEQDQDVKARAPLTPEMRLALDRFFFNWYCQWFRSGAFGQAISRLPMFNQLDDHDLIDGFGSYPEALQTSPVFSSIGSVGYKWYLLFQMFIVDEVDGTLADERGICPNNPSKCLILGGDGAYIPYRNHSYLTTLGPKQSLLAVDWRSERKYDQLASVETYNRLFAAVRNLPSTVEHLVVLVGVPLAYPRMTAMEAILEKKLNPMSLLAKLKIMPSGVNKFNAEAELKDDLADHPCAANHKKERNWLVEEFQKLALEKHIRISWMSGDVHATAQSKFFSSEKLEPAQDPKYMLQIISSAIVNTPPPPPVIWLVDKLGKKTHKTLHHIGTEEELIPLFDKDTDGSKPSSNTVMGRRNYCMADFSAQDEIVFTLCIEKSQGSGTTAEYSLAAPPPRW